ncbi:DsrE family protein [Pseudoalteromonas denitrificans]|uniref:Intracellular sulfur oxidation protein, DsrE/DsrF family n=1 Tax=Pseudoalteromonas denitrificans DSM 6059 TaxID=1123010 RepID=A0A1I1LDY8_9GAMM|nr:DsrE family protein [Pseudoalteromonas denitrificans]SFC71304.1 Intracellular sulfur oxidation protein, DsrE/DsrF family [Pseudoalteromonas denitrificans DSM 6059]
MTKNINKLFTLIAFCISFSSFSSPTSFKDGPLIKGFGKHAPVKQQLILNTQDTFKVVFDVSEQGSTDTLNRRFDSLARFLNMHVANGFAPKNIQLALVVHGKAGYDLLNNQSYQARFSKNNPNKQLLQQLLHNKVRIYLCGQSARYFEINNAQLHTGVKMALSAMTAHVVLNNEGYSQNPF